MTRPRPLLAALAAAATLSATLAGCPAPAGPQGAAPEVTTRGAGGATPAPGPAGSAALATGSPAAAASSPAAALGRSLGEGLTDERDLADYGYIFDDGSGLVAAGGGNLVAAGGGNLVAAGGGNLVAAGGGNVLVNNAGNYALAAEEDAEIDAPQLTPALGALTDQGLQARLRARRQLVATRAKARLAARADRQAFVDAVGKAAVTTDAAKGTKTYRFTASLPWNRFKRQVLFIYTVSAETNMLVHGYSAVLRPRPSRPRKPFHQVRREFTLLADGGFKVTYFQSQVLGPKQLRRVVAWEKTVAADGQVTGSGSIRWSPLGEKAQPPVRQVPITIAGVEEAEAFTAVENGAEAAIALAIDGGLAATTREQATAEARPLDLESVPAEAAPEDPEQPTEL